MPTVTLSSKYQITLPISMVRTLRLKGGDKLVAELIDDHIVLLPQPESWVDYFSGRFKGVWGGTVEEIDQYVAEERASYERDEWREQFDDLMATDKDARKIIEWLRMCLSHSSPEPDLWRIEGINSRRMKEALEKLVGHGAVRRIPAPPGIGAYEEVYRLVRDFVKQ